MLNLAEVRFAFVQQLNHRITRSSPSAWTLSIFSYLANSKGFWNAGAPDTSSAIRPKYELSRRKGSYSAIFTRTVHCPVLDRLQGGGGSSASSTIISRGRDQNLHSSSLSTSVLLTPPTSRPIGCWFGQQHGATLLLEAVRRRSLKVREMTLLIKFLKEGRCPRMRDGCVCYSCDLVYKVGNMEMYFTKLVFTSARLPRSAHVRIDTNICGQSSS